jgi:hypothetical protein
LDGSSTLRFFNSRSNRRRGVLSLKKLERKGGHLAAEPEGFIVEDSEGPLKKGELERAGTWAKGIVESKE